MFLSGYAVIANFGRTAIQINEENLHHSAKPIEYEVDSRGCWICTSHTADTNGYPLVRRNGAKQTHLHRYVYELLVKPIEDGLDLCHDCDNRKCINPSCMFEGTHQDNMKDRDMKGRGYDRRGEKHGRAKLTTSDVVQMRMFYKLGVPRSSMAKLHGVRWGTVSAAVSGEHWSHI